MKRKYWILLVGGLVVVILLLVLFGSLIGFNIGKEKISLYTDKSEYKEGEIVHLFIKNDTNRAVYYENDYNRILNIKENGSWKAFNRKSFLEDPILGDKLESNKTIEIESWDQSLAVFGGPERKSGNFRFCTEWMKKRTDHKGNEICSNEFVLK